MKFQTHIHNSHFILLRKLDIYLKRITFQIHSFKSFKTGFVS